MYFLCVCIIFSGSAEIICFAYLGFLNCARMQSLPTSVRCAVTWAIALMKRVIVDYILPTVLAYVLSALASSLTT